MADAKEMLTSLFTDIADAIREKNGGSEPIVADAFPEAISGLGNGQLQAYFAKTISVFEDDTVEYIGNYAFGAFQNLTTVNFPACTDIGSNAFWNCSALTSISFPACTNIGNYAFVKCSGLETVNFPACTTIGSSAFNYCSSLTEINFPACTTIGNSAFLNCSSLTSVNFPVCITIDSSAFYSCSVMQLISLPLCTSIGNQAFANCKSLISVYLPGSTFVTLGSSAFNGTPMSFSTYTGTFGSIYVPESMVSTYQAATNWRLYSNRITAI